MNTCATCKWHVRESGLRPTRDGGATCTSVKLAESWGQSAEEARDMLIYDFSEGGGFWTGDAFGCVHHEPKT